MSISLDALPVGQRARVVSITAEGGMRRRLLDLGFTDGAEARCLYTSPTGNPRAYQVRGTVIALRNDDARAVLLNEDADAVLIKSEACAYQMGVG